MNTHTDVAIIGAGHAGMVTSYFLSKHGIDHMVLEQGQVGDSWRTQRWDSFTLVTPGWMNHLPGLQHPHPPDEFIPKNDVIAYLESYAAALGLPILQGRCVQQLQRTGHGEFLLTLEEGSIAADAVVVATGAMRSPKLPSWGRNLPSEIEQRHSSAYRRPGELSADAVLVVGSGQSGCQIAEELLEAGKTVYLSVGKCGRMPRRYRGDDSATWMAKAGVYDRTVETLTAEEKLLSCNPYLSGKNGGHEINLRALSRKGLRLVGRCHGIDDGELVLNDDLEDNLALADLFAEQVRKAIDSYIQVHHLDAPWDPSEPVSHERLSSPLRLSLEHEQIGTVVWATGFQPQFSWVTLPVFDEVGHPVHYRGVAKVPGLYFVGLPWQFKAKSSLIYGIEEDAFYVANEIARSLTR